jgi:preprotein translocase subunit SecG
VIYLLEAVHVLVCVFLIHVVLLQQGKGADLSVFGGGSTQTAFGARGATTLLHKLTVASFVIFIVTTVSIALVKGNTGTVMSGAQKAAAAKTAPATTPTKPAPAVPATPAPAPTPSGTPR